MGFKTFGCPSLSQWASRPCLLHYKMLHPLFPRRLKQLRIHHLPRSLSCVLLCIYNPFFLGGKKTKIVSKLFN